LAKIPKALHEHIDSAFPANVCLVGTVVQSGLAQISPRGSTMVFDRRAHRAVGARELDGKLLDLA